MPRRDARFRIEDMRDAVARILTYAAGLSFDEFAADQKTVADDLPDLLLQVEELLRKLP